MAAPRYPEALIEEAAPLRPRIAAQRFMEPLAEPGGRIQTRLEIASLSSIASEILAVGYLRVANGGLRPFRISHVPTAGRILEFTRLSLYPEWQIASMHLVASAGVKRGRQYVRARIVDSLNNPIDSLSAGYVYEGFDLPLGKFVEPGPGGGEGFLSWVSLAADVTPVDVVRVLGATNAFRKILGFVWRYNASADVASRVIVVRNRNVGLALPTGYALVPTWWASPSVTLTASEEGSITVFRDRTASDDNGILAVENVTTAPSPFPYDATEDDLADLQFDVTDANANDRHSIYLLQEEWLVV